MKNFWGYIKNEKYAVGCTGQTVYVFDNVGTELAKFKDVIYAYTPMFCPCKNMFAVKTNDGWLAFYSLDKMLLLKKIHFTKEVGTGHGFCFSSDGKFLLNIEWQVNDLRTELVVYETEHFHVVKRLFQTEPFFVLSYIECSRKESAYYLLGFMRGNDGFPEYQFIAKMVGNKVIRIKKITSRQFWYLQSYKNIEESGFTKNAIEWSRLKGREIISVSLEDIFEKDLPIFERPFQSLCKLKNLI